MASTWFALGLCACAILLTGFLGVTADPTTDLDCPSAFKSGRDNVVTYTVNSAGIAAANCLAASTVVFTYIPKNQPSETQLCSHSYPPLSCNDFTESDTCGCMKMDGDVYTYKYNFHVTDAHLCAQIKARLCVNPSGPFEEEVNPSCNTTRFAGSTLSIVLIVLGQLLFFIPGIVVEIYFHVYRKDFGLTGTWKNNVVLAWLVIAVVGMLIFNSVATHFACEEFPMDSTCTTLCCACIPLTTANCAVVVVVNIVVVIKKRNP